MYIDNTKLLYRIRSRDDQCQVMSSRPTKDPLKDFF